MKLLASFTLALLAFALEAKASARVLDACKSLCDGENACIEKCASHAELFELKADFIQAAKNWDSSVDNRLRVLRSGATIDVIDLCKQTGWSQENQLTCLRSYPTREVIKACKKLSPLQEEQVRCVRVGKTEAEIDACSTLFTGTDLRLDCLRKAVNAQETRLCRRSGTSVQARMGCLEGVVAEKNRESQRFLMEVRARVLEEERQFHKNRMPASQPHSSPFP